MTGILRNSIGLLKVLVAALLETENNFFNNNDQIKSI